ncbi:MAG: cupin domain-containing protein [Haloarculaceae archaeon]
MAHQVVDPQALDPTSEYPCDRRSITDAAGLANLAVAVYELAPGEQLPRTYHYHDRREEVFHVLAGRLLVETPDREYEVPEGAVFVAEPESPHRPYNPEAASEPVRVLGVGAPRSDPGLPYEDG